MGSLFRKDPRQRLREALEKHDWNRFRSVIEDHPELVNLGLENKRRLLHVAVLMGDLPTVQVLIESNADINAVDHEGKTPLHLALIDGNIKIAQYLIENNADVSIRDGEGATALTLASFLGHKSIARMIRSTGANH